LTYFNRLHQEDQRRFWTRFIQVQDHVIQIFITGRGYLGLAECIL
jgi:hypothetical protein